MYFNSYNDDITSGSSVNVNLLALGLALANSAPAKSLEIDGALSSWGLSGPDLEMRSSLVVISSTWRGEIGPTIDISERITLIIEKRKHECNDVIPRSDECRCSELE